ncbi:MAG: HupE/UreJ family protein [Hyphomicrobiaceae bacterium]
MRFPSRPLVRFALPAGILALAALPASAHHAMDGQLPGTFMQGLLSGLGHPVIGLDHLAFIVAIGIAAALVGSGGALIAAFVAASTAGVMAHLASLNVPMSEQLVALSVVMAGGMIAMSSGSRSGWLALAALAGIFHGYAFGESIVGAERQVVGAYLVGIAVVAGCIAWATMAATHRVVTSDLHQSRAMRAAGAMVGAVGVVMLAGSLVTI